MASSSHYVSKCMGYEDEKQYGVWGIGFGDKITANQLGKPKNVWVIGEYGLCEVWVIGESTVLCAIVATSPSPMVALHANINGAIAYYLPPCLSLGLSLSLVALPCCPQPSAPARAL